MGWFRRDSFASLSASRPGTPRAANSADLDHLRAFARDRRGVEAYLEPRTTVTETTVLLVALDGEWTRRRVPGPQAAQEFARELGLPLYDPVAVGYPQRMRDWTAARKAAEAAGRDPAPESARE